MFLKNTQVLNKKPDTLILELLNSLKNQMVFSLSIIFPRKERKGILGALNIHREREWK